MEKEYAENRPIPFHNDVFFKYMLIGDDTGSVLLRSRITEEIYGLKVHGAKVLDPGPLPEVFFGRRTILDVVLKDETGHFYDLGMRVSGYTWKEQLHFQQYGYRLAGERLKQGDEYTELKPFYQIIPISDKPRDDGRIVRHYKVKDEGNQKEPNGTLNRVVVFLPMIKQRVEGVGGVENPTGFKAFCHVLAYNSDDAILNMKRRMVNVAIEKYNEMCKDGSLFNWVGSVEFVEQAIQANLGERIVGAEKLGLEKGLKKGLEKGFVKGRGMMLKVLLIHEYEIDDNWVNSLSDQQIDDIVILILKCDIYDDLKEKLKKSGLKQREEGVLSKFAPLFLFEIRAISPKEKAAGSPLAAACLISLLICF